VLAEGERVGGREAVTDLDENRIVQKVIAVYREAILSTRRTIVETSTAGSQDASTTTGL
jgi:hypothetical protein